LKRGLSLRLSWEKKPNTNSLLKITLHNRQRYIEHFISFPKNRQLSLNKIVQLAKESELDSQELRRLLLPSLREFQRDFEKLVFITADVPNVLDRLFESYDKENWKQFDLDLFEVRRSLEPTTGSLD
jgi:hypothetical protein